MRRQINAIKAEEFPWMLEVPKTAPQQAVKDLGQAFRHFFRRIGEGGKRGLEIDRDLNAAINLERYASTASSAGIDACGENSAGAIASAIA